MDPTGTKHKYFTSFVLLCLSVWKLEWLWSTAWVFTR